MAGKPQISMRIQDDQSILFDACDGVTVRVAFDSPTQVKVEMWRDSDKVIIPPDVGNIGSKGFRDRLAKQARERFNPPADKDGNPPKDTVPNLDEDLGHIATAMGVPELAELLRPEGSTTLVDRLVELVEDAGTLFVTPEGESHAALEIGGHTETHEIRGTRFRRWLRGHFYATEKARLEAQAEASYEGMVKALGGMLPTASIPVKKPATLRDQTLGDAIAQLEAKADYEKRVSEVFVRVGHHGGNLYVDLGSEAWDAVEISPTGWNIVPEPPVYFVRPKGFLPLPYPAESGEVSKLKEVLTLGDSEDDKNAWVLIVAFLVTALRANAPEFPVLVLTGAQGSAKSTTSRMLRELIDPCVVEDTGEPRSKEELHIDADCTWVMAYDNLSSIPNWLSDGLCRISTGSAFTKRTHYTNRDREIFKASQPQILNGIADVVSRGDIIDRGLLVTLPALSEWRDKADVWREFYDVRPEIMAGLYSTLSAGLKSIHDGEEISDKLPRMADFAKFSIRVEEALGLQKGDFLKAFTGSHTEGAATVLEAEPISYHIWEFARGFKGKANAWEGTAKQLLDTINEREEDGGVKRNSSWPKAPNKLSALLGRIAPALKKHGVTWERAEGSNKKGRIYHLYYTPPEGDEQMGDDKTQEGDDTQEFIVPQESALDKANQGEGTIGDDGDDKFPSDTDDSEEVEF